MKQAKQELFVRERGKGDIEIFWGNERGSLFIFYTTKKNESFTK